VTYTNGEGIDGLEYTLLTFEEKPWYLWECFLISQPSRKELNVKVSHLLLKGQAADDFGKLVDSRECVKHVPWPNGVNFERKEPRVYKIRHAHAPGFSAQFCHDGDPPKQLGVRWNIDLTDNGTVTVTPVMEVLPLKLSPEESAFSSKLLKLAGVAERTYTLKGGRLAPFLPSTKLIRDAMRFDYRSEIEHYWGYASEVESFRAAFMDQLTKPV
jgi:hypothetical protein